MKYMAMPFLPYLYRRMKRQLVRLGYYSKPSFLIIGAQKAGTSGLFSTLDQHPQIVAPRRKELNYFHDSEFKADMKYSDLLAYHSQFPLPCRLASGKITFEATPEYLIFPECPQRIHEYNPKMKFIAILRDPIERAYSAWNMYRGFADSASAQYKALADHRTFEEAITEEIRFIEQGLRLRPWSYVRTGMYVEHLHRYFQHFAQDAMLILDYADFLRAPDSCLAATCRFLGIDDTFKFRLKFANVSKYESRVSSEAVNILRSFYQPLNASLFELLKREFEWGRR
jgi:hypothetical protein